jgi:hypothetical protein
LQFLAIVALSIAAAVVYGIAHDQVTVRICLEYFTIGHPPIFPTASPTLLALGWGVLATWWMGLILGLGLATASRVGVRRRIGARELVQPIGILMAVMALGALLSGGVAAVLASRGMLSLWEPLSSEIPPESQVGFLTDLAAHSASYLVGGVGGLVLISWAWRRRLRELPPDTSLGSDVKDRARAEE